MTNGMEVTEVIVFPVTRNTVGHDGAQCRARVILNGALVLSEFSLLTKPDGTYWVRFPKGEFSGNGVVMTTNPRLGKMLIDAIVDEWAKYLIKKDDLTPVKR